MKRTLIIAGSAGTGINTVQTFVETLLKHSGFHLLSYRNYMSRIRGGFNYTAITVDHGPVHSVSGQGDILLALDAVAVKESAALLKPSGLLLGFQRDLQEDAPPVKTLALDYEALAQKITGKSAFAMAPLGAAMRLMGVRKEALEHIHSPKWSDQVVTENRTAALWGYSQTAAQYQVPESTQDMLLVNGNQAVALGALSAGLGFYCAYPMAPSTGIMNYLSAHEQSMQIIVEQAEDEISALIAAIGASSNGVRAMTGTSGSGFALMVEGLGLAAISETPVVIANVQRPGPATGLPTRTEQGDLLFVAHASSGEFPRMVIAPASVEACFYDTFRAFNLADRFQIPVILLSDQQLGDASQTVPPFDPSLLEIHRGFDTEPVADYKRYDYERLEDGRKYPGLDDTLVMTDSHIHDEYGLMTEDADDAIRLKKKFLRRLEAIRAAVIPPTLEGSADADTLFICWGSTYGVVKDALEVLTARGYSVAMLHYTDVYPLNPAHVIRWMAGSQQIINVELNGSNQFGRLLRMETGLSYRHTINRFDGRPFVVDDIVLEFEVINHG